MKKYVKNYFWITVAFLGLNIGAVSVYADIEIDDYYDGADDYYYGGDDVRWIGPGYYWGIWIDNEDDFNNYHDHHGHDDDGYHDGDHRGGESHGGQYHGSGGRSGGGHR